MTNPTGMQWLKGQPETAILYLASGRGNIPYADMTDEQQAIITAFVQADDPYEPYEPE